MDAGIRDTIQAEVHNVVKNTQDQLLNSLTTLLDNRLEGFQKNIQDSQKSLSDTQLAKIDKSMSDTYKFRKRGNEEQYKHNQKVFIKMKEVNNQIETDNLSQENVNANKRKNSEGMDVIKQRQKLIKLVDSSDDGWRVVNEYIANPLADDSDDENKIHKAQSRADSKIKKEKLKTKVDFKTTPYSYKKTASTVGNPIPVTTNAAFRPGRCFFCNERGHWRRECPMVAAEQRSSLNKISIEHYVNNDKSSKPLFTNEIPRIIKVSSNIHYTNNERNVIQKTTGVGRLRECKQMERN